MQLRWGFVNPTIKQSNRAKKPHSNVTGAVGPTPRKQSTVSGTSRNTCPAKATRYASFVPSFSALQGKQLPYRNGS